MVRGTERTLGNERRTAWKPTCHGMNLGGLKALLQRQGRQYARQAFRKHALATSRRANHYQVVPSCGGNLQGTLDALLSLDVREVEFELALACIEVLPCVYHHGIHDFSVEMPHHLTYVPYSIDMNLVHHGCLMDILLWHEDSIVTHFACLYGYGQNAPDGNHRAIQAEFSHHHVSVEALGIHLSVGGKDGYGDGEVEARPFLPDVGRGKVDGNLLGGEGVAAVVDGSHNAFVALLDRIVGQAHYHEANTTGCVDLYGNGHCLQALHDGTVSLYKHSSSILGSMSFFQSFPMATTSMSGLTRT